MPGRPALALAALALLPLQHCTSSKQPLNMAYSINGTLLSADGTPVADATVMVADGTADFPDIACLTDADGGFGLSLQKGAYQVLVQKDADTWQFSLEVTGAANCITIKWTLPDRY